MEEIETYPPRNSATSHQTSQLTAVDSSMPPRPRNTLGGHGQPRAPPDTTGTEQSASIGHGSIAEYISYDDPQPSNKFGWPHLAQKMSEVPEFAAFPRFRQ